MENFKLEAKTQGDKITLSALTITHGTIMKKGITFPHRKCDIFEIASFRHIKIGNLTHVRVIPTFPELNPKAHEKERPTN